MRRDTLELMGAHRLRPSGRTLAGIAILVNAFVPAQQALAQVPAPSEEADTEAEGGAGEDEPAVQDPDPIDAPEPAPALEQPPGGQEVETEGPEVEDPQDDPAAPPNLSPTPLPGTPADGDDPAPPEPAAEPAAPASPGQPGVAAPALRAPSTAQPGEPGLRETAAHRQRREHRLHKPRSGAPHRPSHRIRPRPVAPSPPSSLAPSTRASDPDVERVRRSTAAARAATASPATGAPTYTVRAGDSLWSVAESQLPATASTQRIAEMVQRLWEMNAARIGTGDPDLLLPGQHLRLR